ncbi:protein YIPF1 [Cinnamomum micranthum f. kanehirae]|uniref:Protein YIP n=1 Tax=Cinnamomum micranthum f. kanehirae TaxID=337451 RepID=A0A443P5V7_9MAGN|nr:protein YIPF1 [Cinnamomum micranthum f. kanehirae]
MDEVSYTSLPTSHLLGSVPAALAEDKKGTNYEVPEASLQIFPPNNGGDKGWRYQPPGSSSGGAGGDEQTTNRWKGVFSISSYSPYFNVDTDVVVDRIKGSLYPINRNFFENIEDNPDMYGPVWISTTLVFMLAALGNCATYLMQKRSDKSTAWSFDVSYVNWAACAIYGYVLVVPLAFYFLLQYLGLNASLTRLWCMWGYSLFIFIISSFLLVVPAEFFRWIIIIAAGSASACFVALNMKSYIPGNDLTVVVVSALALQLALAIFIKICFFP